MTDNHDKRTSVSIEVSLTKGLIEKVKIIGANTDSHLEYCYGMMQLDYEKQTFDKQNKFIPPWVAIKPESMTKELSEYILNNHDKYKFIITVVDAGENTLGKKKHHSTDITGKELSGQIDYSDFCKLLQASEPLPALIKHKVEKENPNGWGFTYNDGNIQKAKKEIQII